MNIGENNSIGKKEEESNPKTKYIYSLVKAL